MTGGATEAGGRPGAPAGGAAGALDHAAAARFIETALQRVAAGDARAGRITLITVPAPVGAPERLVARGAPAVFWTTPGAPIHAGLGSAHTLQATGSDRFRKLRTEAEALWGRIDPITHPDAEESRPRLFGGLAFLPGPATERWRAFGDVTFILPRLLYTVDGERARLSVAVTGEELGALGATALAGEVRGVLDALSGRAPGGSPDGGSPDDGLPGGATTDSTGPDDPDDREAWARAVASIQERIAAGQAEKIVAARSREVAVSPEPDVVAMLRRLELESSTAARFAFRLGGDVFLGATPERLIGRTADEVRTEALAGSVSAESPEREERLLKSLKEEVEHDFVVRAIVEALEPLCDRLEYPREPRVQRLRHVLHLQTPFVGRLRSPVHVLELVERMHPTPAVGGWPRSEALAWIDREEPGSRGWYAAPVGWFDDRGDGEFGVALRSALIHNGRAHLFAGAGIVAGSDAAAEYEETEVKLRTMLDALESP